MARKRIAGIFGADAVHAGLLVILAGGLVSGLAGFHRDLAMNEGDVAPVPKAAFALRLDKFSTLYYPDGSVKAWISAVTFLESGKPVRSGNIQVNRPLSYKGFSFYQTSYGWNWDTASIEVWVRKKTDPAFLKKLKIRAGEGAALGDREGTTLAVRRFIPDFVLGANNEPETRSNELKNPAAYLEAQRGKDKIFSGWVFANFPDFAQTHAGGAKDPAGVPDWLFELKNFEAGAYSVLEAARDPGAAIIWLGCALVMAGLGLAFYWPTWEIQAVLEDGQGRTEVVLGGLAAKSREAFGAEFESIAAALRKAK